MNLDCPVLCAEYSETCQAISEVLQNIGLKKANIGLFESLDNFTFKTSRIGTYCVCGKKKWRIA